MTQSPDGYLRSDGQQLPGLDSAVQQLVHRVSRADWVIEVDTGRKEIAMSCQCGGEHTLILTVSDPSASGLDERLDYLRRHTCYDDRTA